MKAPAFWDRSGWRSWALWPAGALYGAISAARMRRPPQGTAGTPVLCVGNLTLGGAGKTPTVLYLNKVFTARGMRPFVLSRGYGGRLKGPLRVDLARHGAGEVGDEPALIARQAPVIIGADRLASAKLAVAQGADMLVMDDGLQNPRLARDVKLAVIDGASGVGNGAVFPAGPLRAPLGSQLDAIDAALVIGKGEPGAALARKIMARGKPVFTGEFVPDAGACRLKGLKALAFCGIGRPEKFRASLQDVGVEVRGFVDFPDHHVLNKDEADRLVRQAMTEGLALVTTPKDQVRLAGDPYTRQVLAGLVNVAGIDLMLDDEAEFLTWLSRKLRREDIV